MSRRSQAGGRRHPGHAEDEARAFSRRGGISSREVDTREVYRRILIVCEGERTEPAYFKAFRLRAGTVATVEGAGMNTISLVREARRIRKADGDFDECWVVMDRDSFPADNFHDAMKMAAQFDINVAWSNEAFELWFLLHFEYNDRPRSRFDYGDYLSAYLGRRYRKNDRDLYSLLRSRQPQALRNAARLYDPTVPPADANPSTTVHLLVARLNELRR